MRVSSAFSLVFAMLATNLASALPQNNGPFANIAIKHSQALLVWSQSTSPGSSTRYPSFKMFDFTYAKIGPDTNLHPVFQPKATQKLGSGYGPASNRHVAVTAGDYMGTGHQRFVAAWQSATGKVNVFMPQINESTLQYNAGSTPSALDSLPLLAGTNEYLRSIQLATGNFVGSDHDQFVLAFAKSDGKIHLRTYDTGGNGNLTPANKADIGDENVTTSALQQFALATGDFNNDGKTEIVLAGVDPTAYSGAGGIYVKIYQANSTGTTLTAKTRVLVRRLPSPVYFVNLAVATGDFDGNGGADIALAYSFYTQDNNTNTVDSSYMVMLKPTPALDNITSSAASIVALPTASNSTHSIAIAAGKIYSDTAAVVVGTTNGYDIYYSTDGTMVPKHIARLQNNAISQIAPDEYAGDASITIGYMQTTFNNSRPSIVVVEDLLNSGGSLSSFRIATYSADPTDPLNRKWDANVWATATTDSAAFGGTNDIRGFAVTLGDFDRRLQKLGTPRYQQPTVVHPTFIVNAPPTHFDVIGGNPYDLNGMFPLTSSPPFMSKYDTQNSQDTVGGTTISSGYDVSAEISASKDFGVASINASVKSSYAHNTTVDLSTTYSQVYQQSTATSTDDRLYAMTTAYNFWEYPFYKGDTLKGYVSVASPVAPSTVYRSLKGANFDFAARHEVGNLLSYMDKTTLLASPAIKSIFFQTASSVQIGFGSVPSTGSLTWSQTTESNKTDSSGLSIGGSVGGGGFGIEVKAEGNYGSSVVQTVKTTVSKSTSMGYTFGAVLNRQDANYTITPIWYWAKNGALVLDYAVDLDLTNPNGFWKTNYGKTADPGFILPYKFDNLKGDTTAFGQLMKFSTPSISFFPTQPAVGDTVTLFARVNNFSLIDIAQGKIHVSFYDSDPASGGKVLKSTLGDTTFSTVFIPGRGQDVAKLPWKVTLLPNGRIYAKITFDTTEIRTDNNLAWNYFANLDKGTLSVSEATAPSSFALLQNYPNPFNPTTRIAYMIPAGAGSGLQSAGSEKAAGSGWSLAGSQVRLTIYDVLGRQVAVLVDGVQTPGRHEVTFDARGFASGMYIYVLRAGSFVQSKKMMLIK
jgi:hypothetical protein